MDRLTREKRIFLSELLNKIMNLKNNSRGSFCKAVRQDGNEETIVTQFETNKHTFVIVNDKLFVFHRKTNVYKIYA